MSDPHFDRALRAAAQRGRPADACPDATLLAAYVDHTLSSAESAAVESHVSRCAICPERLALLASVDVREGAEDEVRPTAIPLLRRWGWLVPVATIALVVAVWIRAPQQRLEPAPRPARTAAAPAKPAPSSANEAPADKDAKAKAAEVRRAPQPASPPSTFAAGRDTGTSAEEVTAPLKKTSPLAGGKVPVAAAPAPPPPASVGRGQGEAVQTDTSALTVGEHVRIDAAKPQDAAAAAPAPVPPPPPPPPAPGVAGGSAGGSIADSRQRAESAKAVALQRRISVDELEAKSLVISGPGVQVRVQAGRIERATNGTFFTEVSGLSDQLRVGACPTANVCWIGGDAGVVYVREDPGESDRSDRVQWTRRLVPGPTASIVRVIASDARHATVDLTDGRRYLTDDGGATWSAVARTQ